MQIGIFYNRELESPIESVFPSKTGWYRDDRRIFHALKSLVFLLSSSQNPVKSVDQYFYRYDVKDLSEMTNIFHCATSAN